MQIYKLCYINITHAVMVQNLKSNTFDNIEACEQTLLVYLPEIVNCNLEGFSDHCGGNEYYKI